MDEAGEMQGSAIVSGGEAAEVFEAIEALLDAIAQGVEVGIVRDGDASRRLDGIPA